tara:strand:- start:127 stop:339 length:213 start_codon:yes stop_codon:yes gene_type:complete
MKQKLNGYPVIAHKPSSPTGGQVVLVNITDNDLHPYVVASHYPILGNTWEHGDYCKTKEEALEVFNNRKN